MLAAVGVHRGEEVEARYNVKLERYIKVRMIELETLHEMISNEVYPAAIAHLGNSAQTVAQLKQAVGSVPPQIERELKTVSDLTSKLAEAKDTLGKFIEECSATHNEEKLADRIARDGIPMMDSVRKISDDLELHIDDNLWSTPKYRELLYVL